MFQVDKALYGPNVPVTVRFSPVLHQWLREKAAKENISFNQMVLLCCKYVMDEEQANKEEQKQEIHINEGGESGDWDLR